VIETSFLSLKVLSQKSFFLMLSLRCRQLSKSFQKLTTERALTCSNRTDAILIVSLKLKNIIKQYVLNYTEYN
jgi:hypothetical protein